MILTGYASSKVTNITNSIAESVGSISLGSITSFIILKYQTSFSLSALVEAIIIRACGVLLGFLIYPKKEQVGKFGLGFLAGYIIGLLLSLVVGEKFGGELTRPIFLLICGGIVGYLVMFNNAQLFFFKSNPNGTCICGWIKYRMKIFSHWNKYFRESNYAHIIPPLSFKRIEKATVHVVEYGIQVPNLILNSIEKQIQLREDATDHYKKSGKDDRGHEYFLNFLRDTFCIFKRNKNELFSGLILQKVYIGEIVLQSAGLPSGEDSIGLKEYLDDLIWMEKQLTDTGKWYHSKIHLSVSHQ